MVRALRLPEFAPDAEPGRDLPQWELGMLPNPALQRHYQARPPGCARRTRRCLPPRPAGHTVLRGRAPGREPAGRAAVRGGGTWLVRRGGAGVRQVLEARAGRGPAR